MRKFAEQSWEFWVTPERLQAHFSRADGTFYFARWTRAIAPVVFGVNDETLPVIKGAIEAVARLAGHDIVETDPEMGANLMMFFVADWSELTGVPDLEHLVPELADIVPKLGKQKAHQYRIFRFEPDGSIRAAFVFLRMSGAMAEMSAHSLALSQAVQVILSWGQGAFAETSPLGRDTQSGEDVLRPEIAALVRAGYDPILPASSADASFGLRLFARHQQIMADPGGRA